MRTTLNKHLLEAFNLGGSDSKRIRKPYRITSSLQNISTDIDSKATVILKDYNNLRRGESSGRKLDDSNRKFKHRNCSARGDSMRQSLNYRDEIKRKDFSVMSRKLSEECFPYTVKAIKRRSPSESRANMDTKVSSLDNLDSKNSTDRLHEKVKELLGRTEDKTFDHILESFDNDISKMKIKVNKDHSFNYRVLRLTETGSLDQEVKNLEERNIKKEIPKKKLRMVIRPKPQSKIDKILSQINILDDSLLMKHNGKGLNSTTISSRTGGQLTAKGPFSMNDLDYANENNAMTIPEMKNKLKEYGTIFHKQISAFKDSGMYLGLKQKEEIQKEIKEADRNLGINGTKRKLLVRKKFGDTIRKILLKMKKLRLNMNNIIKDNAIPTKPFQRHASEAFIKAAKEGDYSTIFEFLLWDEFLVHDFDPTRQTALHWATKRNYTKIMKHLLEKGADPDAKDIMGRTPLFIAAKNSNKTCVKLLLQFGADPLIRSDGHKRPIDYTYDFDVTHLLQRAAQMHIVMKVFPWKQYFIMWKNFNRREFEVQNVELGEVVFRSERDIGLA